MKILSSLMRPYSSVIAEWRAQGSCWGFFIGTSPIHEGSSLKSFNPQRHGLEYHNFGS